MGDDLSLDDTLFGLARGCGELFSVPAMRREAVIWRSSDGTYRESGAGVSEVNNVTGTGGFYRE